MPAMGGSRGPLLPPSHSLLLPRPEPGQKEVGGWPCLDRVVNLHLSLCPRMLCAQELQERGGDVYGAQVPKEPDPALLAGLRSQPLRPRGAVLCEDMP